MSADIDKLSRARAQCLIDGARRARVQALRASRDRALVAGNIGAAADAHARMVEHEAAQWLAIRDDAGIVKRPGGCDEHRTGPNRSAS